MMPLIDVKVLHYLKCTNSKWKRKIKEYIEKSAPKLNFIAKFESQGSCCNGQFWDPHFVAIDQQGNIYVSNCCNHRIQIYDSNGSNNRFIEARRRVQFCN